MASREDKWLVKSGTYILGPFSSEVVVSQLLDKSLSPRDEISGPMKNWISISDEPFFASTVEEVRVRGFSEESTNSSTFVNFTATEELVEHSTSVAESPAGFAASGASQERRSSFSSQSSTSNIFNDPITSGTVNEKINNNSFPQSGLSSGNKMNLNWMGVFLVVLVVGYLFYSNSELSTEGKNKSQAKIILSSGLDSYRLGLWSESLEQLTKAYQLGTSNKEIYGPLAQMLIWDGQNSKARSILNKVSSSELLDYEKFNLMGLSYLGDLDFTLAEKYFKKSLTEKKKYPPALINSGVTLIQQNKSDMSVVRLKESLSYIQDYPQVGLQYVQALIGKEGERARSLSQVKKAISFVEKNFRVNSPLYQESQFVRAYLYKSLDQVPKDQDSELAGLLDNDPYESSQLRISPEVSLNFSKWSDFLSWCDELAGSFSETNSKAVLSFCRFKNGDHQMAQDLIQEILVSKPKSPLYLALSALYYFELKQPQKYESQLAKSLKRNRMLPSPFALPLILKTRICLQQKDTGCAQDYLAKLRLLRRNSLLANLAEANVAFWNKNINKATALVERAIQLAPNYKPYLKLKESIASYEF